MYRINDRQIDYILNDISARGVGMEGLQLNLLDHICCIIEQELEENGDFEQFYRAVIPRFYKDRLSEIEEETHLLLTNKNYYVMKKVMIYSGTFSAAALSSGIFFKYMHWPGASIQIVLGIGIASLLFLPLLVALKVKEQQKAKDKLLIVLGSLSAIMLALAILFKIQHWPGANIMGVTSPAILALVFLPIYFFGGIRNPETKVNTIVSSVLIILGVGLFFTLTITPAGIKVESTKNTISFLRSEQLLENEGQQLVKYAKNENVVKAELEPGDQVYQACESLKSEMLQYATGAKKINEDFEVKGTLIGNANARDFLINDDGAAAKLRVLSGAVFHYNSTAVPKHNLKPIPVKWTVVDPKQENIQERVVSALNDIIQIQMLVLQNNREILSAGQKGLVSVQ